MQWLEISRIGAFAAVMSVLIWLEGRAPRIPLFEGASRWRHYAINLAYLGVNLFVLRLLFPLGLLGVAAVAVQTHWMPWRLSDIYGLSFLHSWFAPIVEGVVTVVLFDLLLWIQHWAFHRLPWLWWLHRRHHDDRVLDLSTGFRFHPVEVLLSFCLKAVTVAILAPTPFALGLWLIVFNVWTLLTHANFTFSEAWERRLAPILITPDLHRCHHINQLRFQHTNLGSIFSIWDRWFSTQSRLSRHFLKTHPVGLMENGDAQPMVSSGTPTKNG